MHKSDGGEGVIARRLCSTENLDEKVDSENEKIRGGMKTPVLGKVQGEGVQGLQAAVHCASATITGGHTQGPLLRKQIIPSVISRASIHGAAEKARNPRTGAVTETRPQIGPSGATYTSHVYPIHNHQRHCHTVWGVMGDGRQCSDPPVTIVTLIIPRCAIFVQRTSSGERFS